MALLSALSLLWPQCVDGPEALDAIAGGGQGTDDVVLVDAGDARAARRSAQAPAGSSGPTGELSPDAANGAGTTETAPLGDAADEAMDGAVADLDGSDVPSFTELYYDHLQACVPCHSRDGLTHTVMTERSLDFTTRFTAYDTLTQGAADGMMEVFEGCRGVPFVSETASTSLLVAALDPSTRFGFSVPTHPGCTGNGISDMTKPAGPTPPAFLARLRAWIDAGAPDT